MSLDDKKGRFERWVKTMSEDQIGREVLGAAFGLKITHSEDLKGSPVVAVLVPSYAGLKPAMMDSSTRAIKFAAQHCTIWSEPVRSSSLVSWVRNDMTAALYAGGRPFTHVLWIDDDMVIEQDAIVRLLRHDLDVVGGLYTCRSDPPVPNVHLMELSTSAGHRVLSWRQKGITRREDGVLVAADRATHTITTGTGLLLVKRAVLDRVGEMYLNCEYERQQWKLTEEQWTAISKYRREEHAKSKNALWFQLLPRMCGYLESGEDSSLCLKAAMCGFEVGVDTTIRPGHIGPYTYSHDDFLEYQEREIAKARREGWYEEVADTGPAPRPKILKLDAPQEVTA